MSALGSLVSAVLPAFVLAILVMRHVVGGDDSFDYQAKSSR